MIYFLILYSTAKYPFRLLRYHCHYYSPLLFSEDMVAAGILYIK